MIPVEKIKGKLLLIGASDDCLWDTVKYISRMEERMKKWQGGSREGDDGT